MQGAKRVDKVTLIKGANNHTSAFNEITKAYAKKAMQNLVFKKEEVETVQDEIKWLHDTMGAGMIVNE